MLYWIWLTRLRGIGPITQKKLLDYFKTPREIYEASADQLVSVAGLTSGLSQSIHLGHSLDEAFSILEELEKKKIKLLVYNDPLYPHQAKAWPQAPILLYYQGKIKKDNIGIVGSRRCTPYGRQVAGEAAKYLAHQDIGVISGLAKGIDSYPIRPV